VFQDGNSPLLNHLARLTVLYEDFRVEFSALDSEQTALKDPNHSPYAFVYFMRRSLATLVEFNSCISQILASPEFKSVKKSIGKQDWEFIQDANRYFQTNFGRLKELRNAVGGHVLQTGVDFATSSFPPSLAGIARWVSPDSKQVGVLSLELPFAGQIIAGAIASALPNGADVEAELRSAVRIIFDSYPKVQGATYAFVHHFLWPKFGR
jgi:hypothetical protein